MSIRVLEEKCNGCRLCVKACPFGEISIVDDLAAIGEGCTLCGLCVSACKFCAIEIEMETRGEIDLSQYNGV